MIALEADADSRVTIHMAAGSVRGAGQWDSAVVSHQRRTAGRSEEVVCCETARTGAHYPDWPQTADPKLIALVKRASAPTGTEGLLPLTSTS